MLIKTSNYTYEASARLEVDELEKIIKTNINSDPKKIKLITIRIPRTLNE